MKNMSATTGPNNTSSSSSEELLSKAEGITFCTILALETVFIAVGNLLTIVLFAMNKNLRKKSLFLVINMSFADLILGSLCIAFYIYYTGVGYQLWTDKLPMFFNILFRAVDTLFSPASIISATLISVERFYAIFWPLKHRKLSRRAYRIVIFMVWAIAILVSTVRNLLFNFVSFKHAVFAWAPYVLTLLFIVCGCNIGIWRKFRRGRIAPQQQNRAVQNQRLTKPLFFGSIITLISCIPLIIVNLFIALERAFLSTFHYTFTNYMHYTTNTLNYSNSFLNPIVYALRIPEFKQALGLCCFRRRAAISIEGNIRRYNRPAGGRAKNIDNRSLPSKQCVQTGHFGHQVIISYHL